MFGLWGGHGGRIRLMRVCVLMGWRYRFGLGVCCLSFGEACIASFFWVASWISVLMVCFPSPFR